MRLVSAIAALLMTASCAQDPKFESIRLSAPITSAQMATYADGGTGRIEGQAFLRQDGGSVVTCAGSEVLLMPDVASTREIVNLLKEGRVASMRVNGQRPSTLFPRAFRKKWCDSDGGFAFDQLASGSWILMTDVQWKAGVDVYGGVMIGYLNVPDDGVEEVILSRSHLI
ncbi:MAG: hypothetical protein AB8B85_14665 [Paracoccaceae bacterium]